MEKPLYEDQRVRLGEAMRRRRNELGISQEALADRAFMDRTYYGGVERGERNASMINLLRICAALDTSASDLFSSAGL